MQRIAEVLKVLRLLAILFYLKNCEEILLEGSLFYDFLYKVGKHFNHNLDYTLHIFLYFHDLIAHR